MNCLASQNEKHDLFRNEKEVKTGAHSTSQVSNLKTNQKSLSKKVRKLSCGDDSCKYHCNDCKKQNYSKSSKKNENKHRKHHKRARNGYKKLKRNDKRRKSKNKKKKQSKGQNYLRANDGDKKNKRRQSKQHKKCARINNDTNKKLRFDNYHVYSVKIKNERQLELLQGLKAKHDGCMFMKPSFSIDQTIELVVPPYKCADITALFNEHEIECQTKSDNLQKLIDEEQPNYSPQESFGWKNYYDLPEIYCWLDQLLEKYPHILTNHNIGMSYENRTIRAIEFSSGKVSVYLLFGKSSM